uniref:Uncharacterized protein n=1 Tax=Athene cunicularia TaxID=194338 RepID=A0A663LND3_ATHCN
LPGPGGPSVRVPLCCLCPPPRLGAAPWARAKREVKKAETPPGRRRVPGAPVPPRRPRERSRSRPRLAGRGEGQGKGHPLRSKISLVKYLQRIGETTLKAENFDFTAPHQRSTPPRVKRSGTKTAGTVLENGDCHSQVQDFSGQKGAEGDVQNIQTGNEHLEDVSSALESEDLVVKGVNPEDCLKTKRKRVGGKSFQNKKTVRSSEKRNRGNTQNKRQRRVCNKQETECVQSKKLCRQAETCVAGSQGAGDQNTDPEGAGKTLLSTSRSRSDARQRSLRTLESWAEGVETGSNDSPAPESEEKTHGLKTGEKTDRGSPGNQDFKPYTNGC